MTVLHKKLPCTYLLYSNQPYHHSLSQAMEAVWATQFLQQYKRLSGYIATSSNLLFQRKQNKTRVIHEMIKHPNTYVLGHIDNKAACEMATQKFASNIYTWCW